MMVYKCQFFKGSHTNLLSGKSMFIDMHDIDSPDKTKPFWRPSDQVVRTWSWSMGRQNAPFVDNVGGATI